MKSLQSFGKPKKPSKQTVQKPTLSASEQASSESVPSSPPNAKKPRLPLLVRRVVGHSMLPVLPPGTLVIGIRYFRNLKPGNVVVILHEGKEKIKRIDRINERELFVLGDHPDASTDSRHFGWLSHEAVTAKIIWPPAKPLQG